MKSNEDIMNILSKSSYEEKLEYEEILKANWITYPTRQFSITMNFFNKDVGIVLMLTVAVTRTVAGLYMIDYGTKRLTLGVTPSYATPIITCLNVALLIILILNI